MKVEVTPLADDDLSKMDMGQYANCFSSTLKKWRQTRRKGTCASEYLITWMK